MKIGFIGTGIMGSRMAGHLLDAGHDLIVHNRTKAKAQSLLENGALWATTPAEAAHNAECVITMLAHPQAVTEAALAPDTGFLDAMPANSIWIDCSTVNPNVARQMANEANKRQIRFMDAPVAGSKNQAQAAQLVFFIGGDRTDVIAYDALFHTMGKAVNHVGKHGDGNALKLVVNHMLATSMMAFAEGLVLGESLGLSTETLMNTLVGGVVAAPYLAGKRAKIENADFEVEFPLRWMQKDMQMVAETAFSTGVSMPTANITKEVYQLASQYGFGDDDFSAIYAFIKGVVK
ncbi:MAG: NAD(P)-dependent oxidoreductase [Phototrophicaceae bacterium]